MRRRRPTLSEEAALGASAHRHSIRSSRIWKTTVARELLALLPSPAAYIEGDTFWSFLVKGSSRGPTPEGFRAIMASMTAAAVPLAVAGRHLLDFSIPPWFLGTAKAIASVRQLPVHFVVLRPSKEVCARRAATWCPAGKPRAGQCRHHPLPGVV